MTGKADVVYQDSLSTGTLTANVSGKSTAMPITFKTKGTRMIRVELQLPTGTSVRIVNNGVGAIVQPDGSVKHLLTNNTQVERVTHIPAFSLLAEFSDPAVSIESAGSTTLSGKVMTVVALRPLLNQNTPQWVWDRSTTKTSFFIDSTGLVSKIAYTDFGENASNAGGQEELWLSGYTAINGILIPFQQALYTDGQLECSLTLNSVTFNTGINDSEFTLPQ